MELIDGKLKIKRSEDGTASFEFETSIVMGSPTISVYDLEFNLINIGFIIEFDFEKRKWKVKVFPPIDIHLGEQYALPEEMYILIS